MTGEIMEAILGKLNARFSHTGQSILLLIDNAGCYPEYLQTKFSNIIICFFRANTTSKLQPLDLGIIANFKVYYRRFLLRYVLSKIEECEIASETASAVNILIAIGWIAQAWKEVKAFLMLEWMWFHATLVMQTRLQTSMRMQSFRA